MLFLWIIAHKVYFAQTGQNSFTILSGNLLHRIDQKIEKQTDFKHVVAATLDLS